MKIEIEEQDALIEEIFEQVKNYFIYNPPLTIQIRKGEKR
jgi:hypothetical protein